MSERCEACGQQTEYNGWSNYETWLVELWIDNEQGTYANVRATARAILANPREVEGVPISPEFRLAEWLKAEVEEGAPGMAPSMYSDLLNAALSRVEWREIAENYIAEAREEMGAD